MTDSSQEHQGGCLCGAVRYTLNGVPDWSSHCHCRSCQKAVGSGLVTWSGLKTENFAITKGRLAICETSPGIERGFCGNCGTSLTYVAEKGWPGQVSVLSATLDKPGIATPSVHVYVADQQPWVKLDDGLPTHERF